MKPEKENKDTAHQENFFTLRELLSFNKDSDNDFESKDFEDFFHAFYNGETVRRIIHGAPVSGQNLNPVILRQVIKLTGLHFADSESDIENESASSVCYAGSSEVREEFQLEILPQNFTETDLLDYACGTILKSMNQAGNKERAVRPDVLTIPYPKSQINFWQLAKMGKEWREKMKSEKDD